MRAAAGEGVVARMKLGGAVLAEAGLSVAGHPFDTVRGWAAFAAMADPARYGQLSVGNWPNDAAKDNPAWVRAVADDWGRNDPATTRILTRG